MFDENTLHTVLRSLLARLGETAYYFASDAHTISLSLRAKIHFWAKAGWLQTTSRPKASLVGSSR